MVSSGANHNLRSKWNRLCKFRIGSRLAIPLSIKRGGSAKLVHIEGGLKGHHEGISPLELEGAIEKLQIDGGFSAEGC